MEQCRIVNWKWEEKLFIQKRFQWQENSRSVNVKVTMEEKMMNNVDEFL